MYLCVCVNANEPYKTHSVEKMCFLVVHTVIYGQNLFVSRSVHKVWLLCVVLSVLLRVQGIMERRWSA